MLKMSVFLWHVFTVGGNIGGRLIGQESSLINSDGSGSHFHAVMVEVFACVRVGVSTRVLVCAWVC